MQPRVISHRQRSRPKPGARTNEHAASGYLQRWATAPSRGARPDTTGRRPCRAGEGKNGLHAGGGGVVEAP